MFGDEEGLSQLATGRFTLRELWIVELLQGGSSRSITFAVWQEAGDYFPQLGWFVAELMSGECGTFLLACEFFSWDGITTLGCGGVSGGGERSVLRCRSPERDQEADEPAWRLHEGDRFVGGARFIESGGEKR